MLDRVLQAADRGSCFEQMDDRRGTPCANKHATPVVGLEEGLRERWYCGGTEEKSVRFGGLSEATTALVVKPPLRICGVGLGQRIESG